MILHVFPSGPLATNAILVGCKSTKRAAVIDPSQGSTDAILKAVQSHGLVVQKILLTHSHWDHIADAAILKEKTNALLFVHPLDAPNVIKPGSDGIPLFFPIRGVQPDGSLEEGKCIDVGHLQFEVIHTPGHSPGSVCLYLRAQKTLLSGDTLFCGAIGRLDLPTGQPKLMRGSLHKLQALPPDTRVISGHGDETTLGDEPLEDFI